jgi:amino acid transporter
MWVPTSEMDITSGLRVDLLNEDEDLETPWTWKNFPVKIARLFV